MYQSATVVYVSYVCYTIVINEHFQYKTGYIIYLRIDLLLDREHALIRFYDIPYNTGGKVTTTTRHFFIRIIFGYILLISVIGFTI